MKPSLPRILSYFNSGRDTSATLTDLQKALRIPKAHSARLREMLTRLVEEGVLIRRGHRYQTTEAAKRGHPDKSSRKTTENPKPKESAGTKRRASSPKTPSARASRPGRSPEPIDGTFTAHKSGFGFVAVPGRPVDVFVPARHIGGAMDGDRVRVEMMPARAERRAAGRISEVLDRGRTFVRGLLQHDGDLVWLAPLNERIPLIYLDLDDQTLDLPDGAFAEAEILTYPDNHDEAPEGRVVNILGSGDPEPAELIDHILSDLNWPTAFSETAKAEMRGISRDPSSSFKGRKDLRKRLFVTIDGADAKDFDDAVCLENLPGGKRRLSVSIADVAAFVTPGSPVDADAYARGTSVYFPSRVVPMLPKRLSNDLCSLKPGVPRLTMTCEMDLNAKGERTGYRIINSIIQSKARLTYKQVQRYFEKGKLKGIESGKDEEIAAMLTDMRALATQLRDMRSRRGALDFTFPEARVELDKKGHPVRLVETFPTESTRLIEQFMLEANETVAAHCDHHQIPIPYRVHDAPPKEQLPALAAVLWNLGLPGKMKDIHDPRAISTILEQVKGHPRGKQAELAILKAMSQARYRENNDGHFALAAEHYAHFTSPIRRYPDLLVHRALKVAMTGKGKPGILPSDTAFWLSGRERTAGEAETRVIRMYKVVYMEPRVGEIFEATVTGLSDAGLWVRPREEPVEGMLPSRDFPGGRPRFDAARQKWMLGGKHKTIQIGDPLRVRLVAADRYAQRLDFELIGFGWEDSD